MAQVRPVRIFGDPVLRSVADPVSDFDESLRVLVDDMMETMVAEHGAGLAANQVGVLRRVIVWEDDGQRGHIVNPEWTAVRGDGEAGEAGGVTVSDTEGCLSIPGIYNVVERFRTIDVRGVDADGAAIGFRASGMLARIIQHEVDHLDGVLFLKRLTPERRRETMAELRTAPWFAGQPSATAPIGG